MFVAVVLMARTRSSKGISVTLCQLFAIGVAGVFADRLGNLSLTGVAIGGGIKESAATANWYGVATPLILFITISLVIYLLWAILGTIRQLRGVLQFKGYRWAWALFVLFVGAYLAGFDSLYQRAPTFENRAFVLLTIFWFTAVMFTYLAVFTETKSLQGYRSYVSAVQRGRISDILQHQPFWLVSLVIAAIALGVNLIVGEAQTGLSREFDKELTEIFQIGSFSNGVKNFLIVASLFLVRDCLMVMTLNFSRNRRRADLAALVYLAVLYVIVPMVLSGFDLERTLLMKFFVPQLAGDLIMSVWPVAAEVAVLAVLMVLRWQFVRRPVAADAA
ncbi:MAG: hypothetical protein OER92_04080, partial [Alphaproteobacteria bacterium]|nr:hypothetical protein [Alphaproteobacteria bacterium]